MRLNALISGVRAQDVLRVDPGNGELVLFGVRLVGISVETGKKLLFSLILIAAIFVLRLIFLGLLEVFRKKTKNDRIRFWSKQAFHLLSALVLVVGLVSIWFSDPTRMTTFLGLVTAGVAFALQRVITAFAGYFVILRGRNFNVGDRIVMGGVRGDVVDLSFLQTHIMEMGEPPSVQSADPAMWVKARQYTGRIVTITNDKIFDTPVYNYTREFPYIWDEMSVPISYKDDRDFAEKVLLRTAEKHTIKISELSEEAIQELERRYVMRRTEIKPQVYWRLTDNWLELTVRFVTKDFGIRDVKNGMSRDILHEFDAAGIGIASATQEIVGMPPLRIEMQTDNHHVERR